MKYIATEEGKGRTALHITILHYTYMTLMMLRNFKHNYQKKMLPKMNQLKSA